MKRFWSAAFLLTLVALGLRLCVSLHVTSDCSGDGPVYQQIGMNVLQHGAYSMDDKAPYSPTFIRMPGYPLVLAAVFGLFGAGNVDALHVVQSVVDTGTCWLVGSLVRRSAPPVAGTTAKTTPGGPLGLPPRRLMPLHLRLHGDHALGDLGPLLRYPLRHRRRLGLEGGGPGPDQVGVGGSGGRCRLPVPARSRPVPGGPGRPPPLGVGRGGAQGDEKGRGVARGHPRHEAHLLPRPRLLPGLRRRHGPMGHPERGAVPPIPAPGPSRGQHARRVRGLRLRELGADVDRPAQGRGGLHLGRGEPASGRGQAAGECLRFAPGARARGRPLRPLQQGGHDRHRIATGRSRAGHHPRHGCGIRGHRAGEGPQSPPEDTTSFSPPAAPGTCGSTPTPSTIPSTATSCPSRPSTHPWASPSSSRSSTS